MCRSGNPVRIAVYHNLPSGGAKRTLYESVQRLSARHSFDVYTLSTANHEFGDLRPYVHSHRVYEFQPGKLFDSPFGRLNMLVRRSDLGHIQHVCQKIAEDLKSESYDVIFVNPCQFETAPSILKEEISTPKIYYCQEPPRVIYESMPRRPYEQKSARRQQVDHFDPLPGLFYSRLKSNDIKNFLSADKVLVNSQFMQKNVGAIYGRQPEVCYLGSDTELFRPLNLPRERVVLSVGSLTPLKNFDFIIQALAEIPESSRPPLWIASNFQNLPERAYLETLAAQLSVQVKFLGNISDDDLVCLYNTAAVAVYTPLREPFGLVPLEAMACETPIVTIREGGMQETILEGETGFMVGKSATELAEKIIYLLDNPQTANELGKNGRRHVLANWTWDRAADRLENYLASTARQN